MASFNSALHPRGPNGRFTRSYAKGMSAVDRRKAAKVKSGFRAKVLRSAEEARAYLAGLFGIKKGGAGTPGPATGGLRDLIASGAFSKANESLRAGRPNPEAQSLTDLMKPLPDDLQLFRQVPRDKLGGAAGDPTSLKGLKVSDAGFFPAAVAPTPPAPASVQMQISVPAGTPAAVDPDSGQVVLGAGVEMAVDSVDVSPDGGARVNLVALPGDGAPATGGPEATEPPPAAAPGAPATPDDPGQPAPATTGGVGDLIDEGMPSIVDNGPEANARRERARQQLGDAMNGTYAGLTAEVTAASRFYGGPEGENPGVRAVLVLRDADGNEVGRAERAVYRDDNGDLVAVHELLEIDDRSRGGGGLASAFNAHLTDWYREQGIRRIELTANIDVGGYAWASHGYDFADENSANGVLDRLRGALGDADGPEADAARALLARAEGSSFGSPDYPTPFEISQLGRPEGASGREATWLGKQVMLGSAWEGTRWL